MADTLSMQTTELAAGGGACTLTQLLGACDELMRPPPGLRDHELNGLQVQGKEEVRRLVCGVTANLALIKAAIDAGADALLVHHGLFWRGQEVCIKGWMRERLRPLLAHDVSLLAYHLPLDAHPDIGNNTLLAPRLGLVVEQRFDEFDIACIGRRADGGAFANAEELRALLERVLGAAGHQCGGAGVHHGRDFRAAAASGAREQRGVFCLRAPRHRALRRAGAWAARGRAVRHCVSVHRH